MSNHPVNLTFGKCIVRTVTMNGIRKFSATDICNILGYSNPNKILGRCCGSMPEYVRLETSGGPQNCRMIGADDIRDILVHSRRKIAVRLGKWLDKVSAPTYVAIVLETGAR